MSKTDYVPPVSQLLTYGDARDTRNWPDYLALGLRTEHIPDLIRMTQDDDLHWANGDSLEVWAPMHAWRVLGQLRAEPAIEPLLGLLRRVDDDLDDWVREEVPEVFGLIGPAAISELATYLADIKHGRSARSAAAIGIRCIAQRHPAVRGECVVALMRQLEKYRENSRSLNGILVATLLDLSAVEAAFVMEQAFAAKMVELAVAGDWEDVQIELGLKDERETPKPNYIEEALFSGGRRHRKRKKK